MHPSQFVELRDVSTPRHSPRRAALIVIPLCLIMMLTPLCVSSSIFLLAYSLIPERSVH